jgi:pre-mRNA-processing factor 40
MFQGDKRFKVLDEKDREELF